MNKFYANLAGLLEVDEIDPDIDLNEYENWDSLTILSVIAMLDSDFGVNMTAKDLTVFKTATELFAELQKRKRNSNV